MSDDKTLNYYDKKLNSITLMNVYDTNIPRVKQYLDSEISYVCNLLKGEENVIELGAGYGRIIKELAPRCKSIVGIDISKDNVNLGKEYLKNIPNAKLKIMDVHKLNFDQKFDVILCLQNGLSSMQLNFETIENILGILQKGGKAFFSTYSEKFWNCRLEWFEEQAEKGLLGEIDYDKTVNGVIVCKDGFKAITHSYYDLKEIGNKLGHPFEIVEVDDSSLFLVVTK